MYNPFSTAFYLLRRKRPARFNVLKMSILVDAEVVAGNTIEAKSLAVKDFNFPGFPYQTLHCTAACFELEPVRPH